MSSGAPAEPRAAAVKAAELSPGTEGREREASARIAAYTSDEDAIREVLAAYLEGDKGRRHRDWISGFLSYAPPPATAEGKALLKAALADPLYRDLRRGLDDAYLHAALSRPEPGDAEEILDAMRQGTMSREAVTGSWRFRAMGEVWDDRFLPFLVEGIRSEAYWWIRAAGESGPRAKAAVPALEAVLESHDGTVRRAAAEALEAITGRAYPVPPSPVQRRSFAENIRRALDPGVPKSERTALAAELPEYDFRPGEKRDLVLAILERERSRDKSANSALPRNLERTLLLAMRDQPDPGDSDRVLELLAGGSPTAYLVLEDSWDDRYVPHIVRDAGGSETQLARFAEMQKSAFEVCGRRRLEACLPALRNALPGKYGKDAASAISLITGRSEEAP